MFPVLYELCIKNHNKLVLVYALCCILTGRGAFGVYATHFQHNTREGLERRERLSTRRMFQVSCYGEITKENSVNVPRS